jgi:TRAP-type C4-dicarboxylate transport system permease small subunit
MKPTEPNAVERSVAALCHAVLWLSTAVIFVILVVNTFLRYVTGSSLQWANEVPELLFPWLVMSGVVLASLQGAHIATTFLMEALSDAVRRTVGAISWAVVAVLYATLSVATFRMLDVVHDEKSPILQLPGSITYGCVMVGMALLALLAVQSAWRAWHTPVQARIATDSADAQVPTAHW